MSRCPHRVEPASCQGNGGDERKRRSGHGDDGRGDEIGEPEARHRPFALVRRKREADQIDELQGERKCNARPHRREARARRAARRPHRSGRHPLATSAKRERGGRNRQRDGPVERHPPGDRLHAVRADPQEDHDEPGNAPEGVAAGRRDVVVEGSEGARCKAREQVKRRREEHPWQCFGRGRAGELRPVSRENVRDRAGEHRRRQ